MTVYDSFMGAGRIAGTRSEQFWANVQKSDDGCWTRTTNIDPSGYSRFGYGQNRMGAHRFAWEEANGPIPEGMQVLHHCDNPPCVRPDHLFLGTQLDNMRDKISKGRARYKVPRPRLGSENHRARLDVDAVRLIRTSSLSTVALARELGVSQATVWYVRSGRTWKHVSGGV